MTKSVDGSSENECLAVKYLMKQSPKKGWVSQLWINMKMEGNHDDKSADIKRD